MKELEQQYNKTRNKHVKLMTYILRGDHASAEDVVQEAYARAIYYYPAYDPKRGPLLPWFNRIMFNALRDIQREHRNSPTMTSENLSNEEVLTYVRDYGSIMDKIDAVENERHQQVLYLFFVLGYSSKEISQIEENMSQTNVTTIVKRFKEEVL